MSARIVDLSLPIYEGMPTDDLGPKFWARKSHELGRRVYRNTQSREARVILMTDHTGTHMDAPLRFDPKGASVADVPIDRLIRPAQLIDLRSVPAGGAISVRELERSAEGLPAGVAAVLWTGHDVERNTPSYFWRRPYLTTDGAEWLAKKGVSIVAADFPGIGGPDDSLLQAKRILQRAGILTVEQLCNLASLEHQRWYLCALPLAVQKAAGSSVRAVGLVNWHAENIVDLSHAINPKSSIRASHRNTAIFSKNEVSYQSTAIIIDEHEGTHLDAPYHFDEQGLTVDALPLDGLLRRARVVDMTYKKPHEGIAKADLETAVQSSGMSIATGDAIVVWTGHSKNFGRPDFDSNRPFITPDGTEWLIARRPSFIVTDLIGLDNHADPTDAVHNGLLRAGIPFLQVATNLHRLAEDTWHVATFPLKLVGGTASPTRAFAFQYKQGVA